MSELIDAITGKPWKGYSYIRIGDKLLPYNVPIAK